MKYATNLEHRASSSRSKHEGEPSLGLCDRLDRTRDNSQRQLPTDHDYAVPTREYQTDQSSLKSAQAAARPVLGERQKQRQLQKQPHRFRKVDTVTPYQANALIEVFVTSLSLGWASISNADTTHIVHAQLHAPSTPLVLRFKRKSLNLVDLIRMEFERVNEPQRIDEKPTAQSGASTISPVRYHPNLKLALNSVTASILLTYLETHHPAPPAAPGRLSSLPVTIESRSSGAGPTGVPQDPQTH